MPHPNATRANHRLLALLAAVAVTFGLLLSSPPSARAAAGVLSSSVKPKTAAVASKASVNLGMKFSTSSDGSITALQFYRSSKQKKAYRGTLWSPNG